MAGDNLFEAVERLEQVSARLERILYGDKEARRGGLLDEFEGLRRDVQTLNEDVKRIKAKRPNVWLWIMGYLSFVASVTFGVVGILNQIDNHNVWGLPAAVALWLAAMLAAGALLMFLSGFGWLDRFG